jgi:hypothetical protein
MQVKSLPCIACHLDGIQQGTPTQEHHLNLGGRAGQKRLGDAYSIPLCQWHHVGEPLPGKTVKDMNWTYGPSLARASRMFREQYGNDTQLLERTNQWLRKQA